MQLPNSMSRVGGIWSGLACRGFGRTTENLKLLPSGSLEYLDICRCIPQRPAPNSTVSTPTHYTSNIAVLYIKRHEISRFYYFALSEEHLFYKFTNKFNGYSSGIHLLPLTLSTSLPPCLSVCLPLYLPPCLSISLLG